jgi:hypothetical protein
MKNKKVKNDDDNDNDNGDDNNTNTTNWLSNIGNQKIHLRWRVMMVVSTLLLLVLTLTFWATCFLPYNNIALLTTYRTIISPSECHQLIQAAEEYVAVAVAAAAAAAAATATAAAAAAAAAASTSAAAAAAASTSTSAASTAAGEDEQRNNNTNTNDNDNRNSNSNEDKSGPSPSSSEWLTERHNYYATTDLSLFSIPKATKLWNSKIQDKVLPVVAAQYDCPIDDLELVDLFIVKYTGGGGIDGQQQDSLDLHMDGSMISFNVALSEYNNDDDNDNDTPITNDSDDSNSYYTGGGTFFPLLNNTDNNNSNNNKTTTATDALVRIHQGDMLVHDSGLLHSGAQTKTGTRYLLVGFVNLRSWKNIPYYLQYRHFGTTATCVNASSTVVEQKEDNNEEYYKYGNNKKYENNEYEIVCPGTRTARKILIRHYTKNFINFDADPDDPTSLPNPLLLYGVFVHIFILLRVLFIMCTPTTPTIPKLNK